MSKNSNKTRQMTFVYNGVALAYDLYVGGVKRLNLRLRSDGTVRLSVPARCTAAERDAFLLRCAPRILQAQERCRRAPQGEGNIPKEIPYLGHLVPLTVERQADRRRICCWADEIPAHLIVSAPADATDSEVLAAIDAWRKQCLEALITDRHRALVVPAFAARPDLTDRQRAYINTPGNIRIRTMTSRWGSCNPATGALTFNLRLLDYPPDCLDYVLLHEFAHFVHPDHSPAFHRLMDSLAPGWQAVRARLKQPPIV